MAKNAVATNVAANVAVVIMTDGAEVSKRIAAFKKLTDTYNTEAHTLAVNSLYHAANSGRPDVIQSFYDAISPAMQGSFRLWLGKRGIDVTPWLSFSQTKGFAIINGKTAAREAFKERAPTIDRPFWKLDANPNRNIVDDKAILGRIMGLLRAVNDDEAHVLPATKDIVMHMAKEAASKLSMVEGASKLAGLVIEYAPAPAKGQPKMTAAQ